MTIASKARQSPPAVIDVTEQTFETEVVARSREVPVVIDFWAPWCGPCRTLGPILERLADEFKGAFVLAKVNVDENPRLSQMFRVQGIPAVKAVYNGQIVNEFTGAQPESRVRAWLKQVIPAKPDSLLETAAALEQTNPQEAAARYRVALGDEPENVEIKFSLGRLLLTQGDPEGTALLQEIDPGTPMYPRAQALLGLSDLIAEAASTPRGRASAASATEEQRYREAAIAARQGAYAEAMDRLLQIVARDRSFRDDGARKAMLGLFALLGDEHPLVGEYRRKLANTLF